MRDVIRIQLAKLGQLFDGPHATPQRRSEGPYFLNIASLKSGRLDLSESDHISADEFSKWTRRVTPQSGDLLFSYETRLGEAALMPEGIEACLGRRMALLRPDPTVADSRFLLYFYLSPYFQRLIAKNTVHGATVPRIGLASMPQWEVEIPRDLRKQRAIGQVLGALDEKIAANERISDRAIALADTLFAQAASEACGGVVSFEDVAEVEGGGTPKTSIEEYWNGDIPWATPTDVTGLQAPYLARTSRMITKDGLAACSSRLYPAGSILMTSRATIGAFAVAQIPLAVNQGFIVINAKKHINQWWLFHEMRARVDEFLSYANGATFLELPRGKFKKLALKQPTVEQMCTFALRVGPLHDMAAQSMTEGAILAATRDELLPLLMSGRIRVRDAEKVVEEVV
jgi:type I restriction enzyme S subunit